MSREGVRNCTSLLLLTVQESNQPPAGIYAVFSGEHVAFKSRSLGCKMEGKSDEGTCIDSYRES